MVVEDFRFCGRAAAAFARHSLSTPFKVCSCGHEYTMEEWRALPRLGAVMDVEADFPAPEGEDPIPPFELRICGACRSTVSKDVPYHGGSVYPPPVRRRDGA